MNRYMDMMMSRQMRDGRNPYGSRGGYVKDRRMQRDYRRDYANGNNEYNDRYGNEQGQDQRDMARYRDMERSGQYDRHYQPIEIMGRFNGYYGGENDYARGRDYGYGSDYARGGDYRQDYARDYGYGSDYNYDMRRDYDYMPYDYAQGSGYLSDKELKMWADKLMKSVDEKDMQFLSKENIRKKADEMGIKFEKYSFEEFYVSVLINYTDHCKTIGNANMDTYLKLAKDFLEDEDSAVEYGEKLATYYDYIVKGM